VAFEALEFTHRPRHERLIDVSQQGIQRRGGWWRTSSSPAWECFWATEMGHSKRRCSIFLAELIP
jgi:hypothetical protein